MRRTLVRVDLLVLGDETGVMAGALTRAGFTVATGEVPAAGADRVVAILAYRVAPFETDPLREAAAGGVPVLLAGDALLDLGPDSPLADDAGLLVGTGTRRHEVRVRPGPDAGELAARYGPDVVLTGTWAVPDKVADGVQQLLTANLAFADHPVCTWRPSTRIGAFTLGAAPATLHDPRYQRLVVRWVRLALGLADGPPVGVGMLGFGAIGAEHASAIAAVDGLRLAAVADANPARQQAALSVAPDAAAYAGADELLTDDAVQLVVVSTPPWTHAEEVVRALTAGRHVVVEKPFCLTVEEADAQLALAAECGRTLAVYQNRRWDADFLALRRAVCGGLIGELFHLETFVGGYCHPCNYWHSDERVSGGAVYDWGSHYLDWVLDLVPREVEWVSATAHKRVWHDVTNADHTRVLLHFAGGVEAEFSVSDLAAVPKPKFYALGTVGAVVGDWRTERVVSRGTTGLLEEDVLAPADAPARMRLVGADGSETVLATPPALPQPFHRELADQLLTGIPMSVTPAQSRRTVAVMQAATESARAGGRPVVPQR